MDKLENLGTATSRSLPIRSYRKGLEIRTDAFYQDSKIKSVYSLITSFGNLWNAVYDVFSKTIQSRQKIEPIFKSLTNGNYDDFNEISNVQEQLVFTY